MLTKIVVLVCVFMCSLNMHLATNFKWRRVKSHDDSISNEDTLFSVDSVSMLQCSRNCLDVTGCVAFYYNRVTRLCQLQSNSSPDPVKRKHSTGTKFYVNTCMQYHYSYNAELRKYYQRHTSGISTHANATDTCIQNGGRLITLSRKTEFKAMQSILKSKPVAHISKEGFWVGAKVNTLTKKFEWDDGVKVKKGFWAPQQPDYDGVNTFTECVLMIPIFSYKLDDFNCTLSSNFVVFPICECALI